MATKKDDVNKTSMEAFFGESPYPYQNEYEKGYTIRQISPPTLPTQAVFFEPDYPDNIKLRDVVTFAIVDVLDEDEYPCVTKRRVVEIICKEIFGSELVLASLEPFV